MESINPISSVNPSSIISNPVQNQKSLIPIILGGLVLLALVGYGGYYLGTHANKQAPISYEHPTPTSIIPPNETPTASPTTNNQSTGTKSHTIPEGDLTFSAPSDMEVTYETQKIIGTDKTTGLTLFVQKGTPGKSDYYQLYGVYQWDMTYTMESLQAYKEGLEPSSIKEISSTGYPMLEGQIKGGRNRYVTYILAPKGIFSLYTSEPTLENKLLTDQIVATFTITR